MNNETEYYSRQIKVPLFGKNKQDLLSHSKILIVGAGGLGHPVAAYLAGSGVGSITIIDHDVVNVSNLHRQVFFNIEDIEKPKAEILATRLRPLNPHITINSLGKRLDAFNAIEIIQNTDIVVDCSDNLATKFLLHDTCLLLKKTFILGAIDQTEGEIKVFHFNKVQTPCLRCLWINPPSHECITSCAENGVIPQVAGIVGTTMSFEVIKCILDISTIQNGDNLLVDCLNNSTKKIRWKKSPACPFCSQESDHKKTEIYKQLNLVESPIEISSKQIENLDDYEVIDLDNTDFDIEMMNSEKKYLFVCQFGIKSYEKCRELRNNYKHNSWSLFAGKNSLKYFAKEKKQ